MRPSSVRTNRPQRRRGGTVPFVAGRFAPAARATSGASDVSTPPGAHQLPWRLAVATRRTPAPQRARHGLAQLGQAHATRLSWAISHPLLASGERLRRHGSQAPSLARRPPATTARLGAPPPPAALTVRRSWRVSKHVTLASPSLRLVCALPVPVCRGSFDDKLYSRSSDRLRVSYLPDTGLHGGCRARGARGRWGVPWSQPCGHPPANQPVPPARFWVKQRKGLERIRNARVHGELQAGRRAYQAQFYRSGRARDGCRSGGWLMQRANRLRLCPGYKPLTHGWTLGTGALSSRTTDGHQGQLCAAGERSGVEVAVEVSEEGA